MNRKFLPLLILAAFISVALFSCRKETDNRYTGDVNKAYFPLDFGRYVVYDVDSTLWDDFLQVRSLHRYQMMYTVADTFRDNENRLSYRMDVRIRNADTLPWKTHRVIYVTPTDTRLELVEGNVRYIKQVYPIADNIEWQGNSMIPTGDQDFQYLFNWIYKYSGYTKPYNNGRILFDNTVKVSHVDEVQNDPELMPTAYAYKTFSEEVYAFNVGMVYREMTHWIYDPTQVHFRKGYSVTMRAVDHN
jgi:hypothetical protein